jgi:tRNA pseudouridine38-40 synthase
MLRQARRNVESPFSPHLSIAANMRVVRRWTYRVDLAYDGTRFAGFARQPGERTVESTLVGALAPLVPELEAVAVGGRTDRGVSAVGQVISFWARAPLDVETIGSAIDRAAPDEVAALSVVEVPRSFHAQHSARHRRYTYLLEDDALDAYVLDAYVSPLIGRRSFDAFARDTPRGKSTVRTLLEARVGEVRVDDRRVLRFDFAADGFLRHQVRVLVASAVRAARTRAPEDELVRFAESGDRRSTAPAADARGLYLVKIGYDAVEPRHGEGRSWPVTVRSSSDIGWLGSIASAFS